MESDPVERAEEEYQAWALRMGLDSEDTQTMIAYEEAFEEEHET